MPTYRQQIETTVDEMVKAGRIQEGMRSQYVDLLAKDEAVAQEFAGRFMRHDDYTRKTQEVARQRQEAQAAIEADRARVAQERQALQQWETEARAEMQRLKAQADQYPELQSKVAAYEQALRDFNMMEHVQVPQGTGGQPAVPPTNPYAPPLAQPAQPQSNYLTREDVGLFAQQMLELNAKTLRIAGQHQRLFGQPLEDDIITEAMTAGQDPQAYWETKYNVAGKRAEIATREREAEIARIREEERAKIVAEYATDPSRLNGGQFALDANQVPTSKAFETFSSRGLATTDAPPAPELAHPQLAKQQRVDRAAAAWDKLFDASGNPRVGGGPAGSF